VAGSWPSTLRRSREAPTARRRCAAAPAVIRYAYVVENLERSIDNHVERLGVGPWSLRERFRPTNGRYRGEPTDALLSLARAFSGMR